jgi:hypothetical protein
MEVLGAVPPPRYNIHVHFWIIAMRRYERRKLLAHFGGGEAEGPASLQVKT